MEDYNDDGAEADQRAAVDVEVVEEFVDVVEEFVDAGEAVESGIGTPQPPAA